VCVAVHVCVNFGVRASMVMALGGLPGVLFVGVLCVCGYPRVCDIGFACLYDHGSKRAARCVDCVCALCVFVCVHVFGGNEDQSNIEVAHTTHTHTEEDSNCLE
jgi:hypothetical protein